jgi:FkbH-like protein
MAEAVRLLIWDLDETFWRGTLTEGGIRHRADTRAIVEELAQRGILSGICSKNDPVAVREILEAEGIWDRFIFPSIDWSPKGPRIKRLIEQVQLRPESVMLIDDNPQNLEEARFFAPGLQAAPETAIDTLLDDPRFAGKDDRQLSRLRQYKLLEARKADEERLAGRGDDGHLDFLRASGIRLRIENDVEAHLDRAIELINRTNQLNFLKRRLPEQPDLARAKLREELALFTTQAGLISVADRYGDHGFCGYFQVSTRRDRVQLTQFCFSCRILGMGVEAWTYQRLGRPALKVRGEVLSNPAKAAPVDWIRLENAASPAGEEGNAAENAPVGSVSARGGCVLWPLVHYFRLSSPKVVGEFNLVRNGKLIRLDHSLCLRNAITGATEEQIAAVVPLGFAAEDFRTEYFDHEGDKPLWILSNWVDIGLPVFRHRHTGISVPLKLLTHDENDAELARMRAYLDREFDRVAYGEDEFKQTMAMVFSRIPAHGLLFLLLINEDARQEDGGVAANPRRQRLNRWCAEVVADRPNIRLLNMADFVRDASDFTNAHHTHFERKVYHRLFEHITAQAQTSRAADLAVA